MTIPQTFDAAVQHHLGGRLAEAEEFYRQILAEEPRHAEALHFLGVIAHQVGQNDVAVELIRQAIALQPGNPESHNNLGVSLKDQGLFDEAIAEYRQALALRPDNPEALNNVGVALKEKGQLDEAIAAYRRSIALQPGYAEAHYNLGIALYVKGQWDEAIAAFRQTIALKPSDPRAYNNLGNALKDKGQVEEAIAAYRQALALRPDYAKAHNNLGAALKGIGQIDEAMAACRRAIALDPGYPEAHNNLGIGLYDKGQMDEAIAEYRQAIALKPDYPEAHFNLGHGLLLQGHLSEAWQEYEWRYQCKECFSPHRNFTQPKWDGTPLAGRTLLLQTEQGCGDAIQFVRYVPLVRQRGGKVIIECQPELRRLFQPMIPEVPVFARGQMIPAFDVHCPLLSLPGIFSTGLSNIPQTVPYLQADAAKATRWRERLAGDGSRLKVGLVWAGTPIHNNDRNRSMKLASLAPLAEVSGVRFYSMQKGGAGAEAGTPPRGMELVDVAEELKDFADTAALIANLDLVIAVDTAVVHLAGAMGRPVWTLLPFAPDWRWLLDRTDSPWYPTMRLFRQPKTGDWDTVVAEVGRQLRAVVQKRRIGS